MLKGYTFSSPLLVRKEGIFIFLVGDVVDTNIMDGCNRNIWMCMIFIIDRIDGDLMHENLHLSLTNCFILGVELTPLNMFWWNNCWFLKVPLCRETRVVISREAEKFPLQEEIEPLKLLAV